jgi:hypothetical protein
MGYELQALMKNKNNMELLKIYSQHHICEVARQGNLFFLLFYMKK